MFPAAAIGNQRKFAVAVFIFSDFTVSIPNGAAQALDIRIKSFLKPPCLNYNSDAIFIYTIVHFFLYFYDKMCYNYPE